MDMLMTSEADPDCATVQTGPSSSQMSSQMVMPTLMPSMSSTSTRSPGAK